MFKSDIDVKDRVKFFSEKKKEEERPRKVEKILRGEKVYENQVKESKDDEIREEEVERQEYKSSFYETNQL